MQHQETRPESSQDASQKHEGGGITDTKLQGFYIIAEALLQLRTFIPSLEDLLELIDQHKDDDDDIQFEVINGSHLCRLDKTYCKLKLKAKALPLAERFIKKLRDNMNRSLGVAVNCSVYSTEQANYLNSNQPQKKNSGFCSKTDRNPAIVTEDTGSKSGKHNEHFKGPNTIPSVKTAEDTGSKSGKHNERFKEPDNIPSVKTAEDTGRKSGKHNERFKEPDTIPSVKKTEDKGSKLGKHNEHFKGPNTIPSVKKTEDTGNKLGKHNERFKGPNTIPSVKKAEDTGSKSGKHNEHFKGPNTIPSVKKTEDTDSKLGKHNEHFKGPDTIPSVKKAEDTGSKSGKHNEHFKGPNTIPSVKKAEDTGRKSDKHNERFKEPDTIPSVKKTEDKGSKLGKHNEHFKGPDTIPSVKKTEDTASNSGKHNEHFKGPDTIPSVKKTEDTASNSGKHNEHFKGPDTIPSVKKAEDTGGKSGKHNERFKGPNTIPSVKTAEDTGSKSGKHNERFKEPDNIPSVKTAEDTGRKSGKHNKRFKEPDTIPSVKKAEDTGSKSGKHNERFKEPDTIPSVKTAEDTGRKSGKHNERFKEPDTIPSVKTAEDTGRKSGKHNERFKGPDTIPSVKKAEDTGRKSGKHNEHFRGPNTIPSVKKAEDTGSKSGKHNEHIKGPLPIPTKLAVKVYRTFSNEEEFLQYFNQMKGITMSGVQFENITNISQAAECQLTAPSKTAADKIAKKLISYTGDKIVVRRTPVVVSRAPVVVSRAATVASSIPVQTDLKANRIETEKDKVLVDIHNRMVKMLIQHLMKIEDHKSKLRHLVSSRHTRDDKFKMAVEKKVAKLKGLEQQRKEFYSHCVALKNEVKSFDCKAISVKELSEMDRRLQVECLRFCSALPVFSRRKDIVQHIQSNQVSIILGETGSGKSTQIVQYLLEAGFAGDHQIVCTQPRKMAAIALADRVAKEMRCKVGGIVGHKTGVEKKITKMTKIVFLSDYCLLRECVEDPLFTSYSCIIVDEAHERCIYTDVLLSMVKACLPKRPDLRVVIMSATMEPKIFIDYFQCGPELKIFGRTYPVEVVYDDKPRLQNTGHMETRAICRALEIHNNEDAGDILVFLTSQVEISRCIEEFEKKMNGRTDFKCFPLHGQLTPDLQQQVFEQLPRGKRKIVFATNIAETSITIEGIKYVVDPGVAKEVKYNPKTNMSSICKCVISKSSADQRKGRAGRTASGKCYRLYTEEEYASMASSTEPEILRTHLGHAFLKLAELGTDVKTHDFMQSPSAEAIDCALGTLQELGAISSNGITHIGRFLAKLPFDPRQGFILYEGKKRGLLYDALVLAALISNSYGLFYRGLNDTEQEKVAKSRLCFASPCGDAFTWLEIYKKWIKLPKDTKSKWCKDNCINYKALSVAKKCVRDVSIILEKELKIKTQWDFSSDVGTEDALRKIILKAHASSLCVFLGHSKVGYYALSAEQTVYLHPSSTLVAQSTQPEWIVYNELVQTSRDFVKCVTVVEADWIREVISEGHLKVDMTEANKRKLRPIHREEVGMSVFKALVGPRYCHLEEMANDMSSECNGKVILEANRGPGTLEIFSSSPSVGQVLELLEQRKQRVIDKLTSRVEEIDKFKTTGEETCGFSVLLGQGGVVTALLMPGQSTSIIISNPFPTTTEEEVRSKFEKFGDIVECKMFTNSKYWGLIRYGTSSEATKAVEDTHEDDYLSASLRTISPMKSGGNTFEARLSWYRREVSYGGRAFIECDPMARQILIGKSIVIAGKECPIECSHKFGNSSLICSRLGEVEETEIKNCLRDLLSSFDSDPEAFSIKVHVPREKAYCTSKQDIEEMRRELSCYIEKYFSVPKSLFELRFNFPKDTSIKQVAFIHFKNATIGFRACKDMEGQLAMANQIINISPKLKTNIRISKAVMNACREKFENIEASLKDSEDIEIKVWQFKQRDYTAQILSSELDLIVEARNRFSEMLQGTVIDCEQNCHLKILLRDRRKNKLNQLEKKLSVLIITDSRREKIHLYGASDNVALAQKEIEKFSQGKEKNVSLKGKDRPASLMRALMEKYGSLDEDFRERFSLTDVAIDFRDQVLTLRGASKDVELAEMSISQLSTILLQSAPKRRVKSLPVCSVCLSDIEQEIYLYRMEGCGHSYCLDCLKMQVTCSVNNSIFPLSCCHTNCGMNLVWADLEFCIQKQWITQGNLAYMSVNAYVSDNQDKYRFCLTPNCPVAYEITHNEEGNALVCPSCSVTVCTSCHKMYHEGFTCKMTVSEREKDKTLAKWRKKDPDTRKICPGCRNTVEKKEGCNQVRCYHCKKIFCWNCLEIFEDSQKCYAHLVKTHGDIFNN